MFNGYVLQAIVIRRNKTSNAFERRFINNAVAIYEGKLPEDNKHNKYNNGSKIFIIVHLFWENSATKVFRRNT